MPDQAANQAANIPSAGAGERERARIDSGQTGDKVPMNDPAMSPLGTDDEAAALPDPDGMATARQAPGPAKR